MDIEEMIKKLDEQIALHRRVCDDPLMYTKEERLKNSHYAQAICAVVADLKKIIIPAVVKSLPTDECVEQWWAEGQDQKEGFWQETPSRTNGDVVEEIKTALKYFIETWQR